MIHRHRERNDIASKTEIHRFWMNEKSSLKSFPVSWDSMSFSGFLFIYCLLWLISQNLKTKIRWLWKIFCVFFLFLLFSFYLFFFFILAHSKSLLSENIWFVRNENFSSNRKQLQHNNFLINNWLFVIYFDTHWKCLLTIEKFRFFFFSFSFSFEIKNPWNCLHYFKWKVILWKIANFRMEKCCIFLIFYFFIFHFNTLSHM